MRGASKDPPVFFTHFHVLLSNHQNISSEMSSTLGLSLSNSSEQPRSYVTAKGGMI